MEVWPKASDVPTGRVPGAEDVRVNPTRANQLRSIIAEQAIEPHFHPIVDLSSGTPIGYEMLARGRVPFEDPERLFGAARALGLAWDLEKACRAAALERIAALEGGAPGLLFFVNVSPDIITDPRFIEGFTLETLRRLGIDQRSLVLEITEKESILDHTVFESLIRHYADQGFQVALDDFGAGYSGLQTLVTCAPHFLKLDRAIVRDVHLHDYKQLLVRSLLSFTSNTETRLIAEGVESMAELSTLVRLGVRYGQGFLFAEPATRPTYLEESVKSHIRQLVHRGDHRRSDFDEAVRKMVIRRMTVDIGTTTTSAMHEVFSKNPRLDHVVFLDQGRPVGLSTRQSFYLKTGGPYGFALFQSKKAETVAKRNVLVVEDTTHVTRVAQLAMDRLAEDVYDPVVVVDREGIFQGTVTMKQLLTRSIALEIETAQGVNPLTGLPGNRAIQRWLAEMCETDDFTVVYCDLDHFKQYNDVYGFVKGDDMIRFTAESLREAAAKLGDDVQLGHVGGDDFVLAVPRRLEPEQLGPICARFDERKRVHFLTDDVERGGYVAVSRRGVREQVPLTTLSMAVVEGHRFPEGVHPALLAQVAAELKKRVKSLTLERGASAWVVDRRVHERAE